MIYYIKIKNVFKFSKITKNAIKQFNYFIFDYQNVRVVFMFLPKKIYLIDKKSSSFPLHDIFINELIDYFQQ